MGDQETTVKNEICSLLVSTPLSCTIRQLCCDYRNQIGQEIPFRKLGYNSVEHFLKSIPDKVLVMGSGPQATLKLVLSEKTAHVNAMVMKQKVNTRQKGCMNRRRAVSQSYNNFQSRSPSQKIVYPNNARSSNFSKPTQNYAVPSYSQTNYEHSSNTSVSTPENYKSPSYPQAAAQVSNYNNHQAGKSPHTAYPLNYPPKSLPSQGNTGPPQINRLQDEVSRHNTFRNDIPSQRNTDIPQFTNRLQEEAPRPNTFRYDNFVTSNTNELSNIPFKCDNNQTSKFNFESPSDITKTSQSLSGAQFAQEVEPRPTQRKLELKDFKKKLTIGDTFEHHVSLVPNQVPPKNRITINLNLDKKDTCESEASQIDIPKTVQDNLRELISSHPEGIWCAELSDLYRKIFRRDLNFNEYGYRSLINLCMDLPELFHYVRPANGDFKLYDRSKPLPEEAEKTFTMASYSVRSTVLGGGPLPDLGCPSFTDYLPQDIVIDEKIPRQFVPEGTKEGDYLEITVAEIFDLSKFWIYLQANGLDELMDQLQMFYGKDDRYLIPDLLLKEGLYCVCKFFSEFHRAVIIKVFENEPEIKVLFVDYGTVTKVSRDGIYFLKKQFAQLPFQSIRARLANIYPVAAQTTWSIRDTEIFHFLINRKHLAAQINKILPEQVLDLYLLDRETGQCINDLLVDEGVALYTTQERRILAEELGYKPRVKHLHLFPSHMDFELGIVPSTADFKVLSSFEVPFHLIYPQYFEWISDVHLVSLREKWCEDFKEWGRDIYRVAEVWPERLTTEDVRDVKSFIALDTSIYGPIEDIMKSRIKKQHMTKQNKHKTKVRVKRNEQDERSDELFIKSLAETVNKSSDCPVKEVIKPVENEGFKDDENDFKDDENFDGLLQNMNSEEKTSKWILDLNSNEHEDHIEYEDEYLQSTLVTSQADFSQPHTETVTEEKNSKSQFLVDSSNLDYQFIHNIPKHLGANLSNTLYDEKIKNSTDGWYNVHSSHIGSNNFNTCSSSNSENEFGIENNFSITFEEKKETYTEDMFKDLNRTSENDRTSDRGTTSPTEVSDEDVTSSEGTVCASVYQEDIYNKNVEDIPSKEVDARNSENLEKTKNTACKSTESVVRQESPAMNASNAVETEYKKQGSKVNSNPNISNQSCAQNVSHISFTNFNPSPFSNNCPKQVESPVLNSSSPAVTECKEPSAKVHPNSNISNQSCPQNFPQQPFTNFNPFQSPNNCPKQVESPVLNSTSPDATESMAPSSRVPFDTNVPNQRFAQDFPPSPYPKFNPFPPSNICTPNNFPPNYRGNPVMPQQSSFNPTVPAFIPQVNRAIGPPPGFSQPASFNNMPSNQIQNLFCPSSSTPSQPMFIFNNPMFIINENKPDFFSSYNQYLMTLNAAANGMNMPSNANNNK